MLPTESQPTSPGQTSFYVVGLAAAAGGMSALQQFFAAMPCQNGMAFVVMLHLPPTYQRYVATILEQATAMPVLQVDAPTLITPETIYLLPPAAQFRIAEGRLILVSAEHRQRQASVIDLSFRMLAETYGRQVAGIVLSGAGADGSVGIARLKETGGIVLAQDPQEAEYDAMPRHAIASGLVDFVLPVAAMPAQLLAIRHNSEQIILPIGADLPTGLDEHAGTEDALSDVLAVLRSCTGHDFINYKRAILLRRIERRMQVTTTVDLPDYYDYLQHHPREANLLLQDLLMSVTKFFRDEASFAVLEREVVPQLFSGKTTSDTVRVWVPGCASGEEVYSIAILLLEYALTISEPPAIQIFASDINEKALQVAREGCYSEAIAADVAPERLRQFFIQEPGGYRVTPALRERVIVASHNLLSDPPFSRLDLISCRNLLIYFNREVQQQIFDRFHFALHPGGFLLLGSAEAPDVEQAQFSLFAPRHPIYRADANTPVVHNLSAGALQARPLRLRLRESSVNERAQIAFSELHQRLLKRSTRLSVVVDSAHEIVHMSEEARDFLQLHDGRLSFNLLMMVPPELRSDLRTALVQALQTGQSVTSRCVKLQYDGRMVAVTARILPEQDVAHATWFALVIFDLNELDPDAADLMSTEAEPALASELQGLRTQLDLAFIQHSATVEALRASNEELLAGNEELRTLTEELETSREELHSVNEELRTVNDELNYRVDELSATNNDLNNLIAATEIATLFLSRDLKITRFTPQVRTLFNLILSDEGRPLSHITHQLDYDQLLADAELVLQSLQPLTREVSSQSGQVYVARLAPYRTTSDQIGGLVLTFVDISKRKYAEAELARAYASEQAARIAAEQALQTRDQFLSIAAHELRTPMTSLYGYAQLLRRSLLRGGGDPKKMVDRVVRQSKRLDELIDQLLDVSRLQHGQFVIERQVVDLAALSAQVVSEFRDTLSSSETHLLTMGRPSEAVLVSGDAGRLEQLLLNLLRNAVKYSPRGKAVYVRVATTASEALLEVSDQGIGIPTHVQDQLFKPFFRAPNVGSQARGFGLGLYIVHEIVQRHGGRIEVESAESAGSSFRVFLPLLARDAAG